MLKTFYTLIFGTLILVSNTGYAKEINFCNATNNKIAFSKAYTNAQGQWVTAGWFQVESNKCQYGDFDGVGYYYAKNVSNTQFWGWTGTDDKSFCASNSIDPILNADQPCTVDNSSHRTFRKIVVSAHPENSSIILGDANSTKNFEVCNSFTERVSTSVGWEKGNGIITTGWWAIQPNQCTTFSQLNAA